jgi:putative CocE/NonD family hydrolase
LPRDHRDAVSRVTAPVHLVGGWYDYYLRGLLRDYHALVATGHRPYLTIGPWYHGQPEGLLAGLRAGLAWFDAHLKGQRAALREDPVRIRVMGQETWRDLDAFPPPVRLVRYYLHPAGGLSTGPPPPGGAPDSYRYDPADPTPAVGGALLALRGAGARDNRALEARPDVLCYTTEPLARDVEVAGLVRLELFARSSLAHTDFFGRLCDVAPDGRSTNVCDGLVRVAPGSDARQADGSLRLEIDLWATAYRFLEGHRLRLQVSSGAHPRWSRNLGTGESLTSGVGMAPADQAIYHDATYPSAIVLPVVNGQFG